MKRERLIIESFEDFIASQNNLSMEYRNISESETKITKLENTGISVVTFGKNSDFQAPDNKPYILLLAGSVQFLGGTDNKEVSITLQTNDFEKPGVYKNVTDSAGTKNTRLTFEKTLDIKGALDVMPEIVTALYGSVTKDRVTQTIKAMNIIRKSYAAEIANCSLFTSLFKNCVAINNAGTIQKLYALAGNKKTANMAEVYDGAKGAFGS